MTPTTSNIARSHARKQEIRAIRNVQDQKQAEALGISVPQLRAQKAAVVEEFRIHPLPVPYWVIDGYSRRSYY